MIDWHSILVDHGVVVLDKPQFNIHCPFHTDARESCSINIEKQVWICHAGCGQGHLKSFLQKLSGKSWQEINELLDEEELELDFNLFEDIDFDEEYPVSLLAESDSLVDIPDNHWIFKRGFTTSILNKWDCKSNQYNDLVIPVKNSESMLMGLITRRVQATPKYLFSRGFKKSKALFGIDNLDNINTLFVVEGAFDAMWLDQYGYASVAILGASISSSQISLISSLNPTEVVLCLDNDDAGRNGISKATVDMSNRFMLSYVKFPKGYKDVQEIQRIEELNKVIQNRTLW